MSKDSKNSKPTKKEVAASKPKSPLTKKSTAHPKKVAKQASKKKIPSKTSLRDRKKLKLDYVDDCQTACQSQPLSATPIIPALTVGATAVLLLVTLMWMAFMDVDLRTFGAAVAKQSNAKQVVQNLEGGRVRSIEAKPGDMVKAGQLLVQLDDAQYQAQFKAESVRRAALQAQVARLNSLIKGDDEITFPEGFREKHPDLVRNEEAQFHTEVHELKTAIRVLENRKQAADHELKMVKPLIKKKILAQLEQSKLELKVADLEGEISNLKNKHLSQASKELSKRSTELMELNAAIKQLEDKINHAAVKSPIDGVVNERKINTVGEVIKPDTTMFTISPLGAEVNFEAEVPPEKIGFVHMGQEAAVQINAYDYVIYGQIKGKVSRISHDTIVNDEDKKVYKVVVSIKEPILHYNDRKLKIKPGMTGSVHILTNKTSLLTYVMKPFIKTFKSAVGER